jgi:sec-independent protein translocase protein TatA
MTTPTHTLAFIGNFGGGEIILIFLIVLLLFGAKKVPELFRSLGKGVNEFRKAKNEWEQDINEVMSQEPIEDHDFSESEKQKEEKETEESVPQEGEKQTAK